MKNNRGSIRFFWQILGYHLIISGIYFLALGTYHPFQAMLSQFPLFVQIPIAFIFAFVLYIVPGYLFVIAKKNREDFKNHLVSGLTTLTTVIFLFFIVCYLLCLFLNMRWAWAVYAIINPAFGPLSYQISTDHISIFWVVSCLAPVLGLYSGIRLRLRGEEA